MIWQLPNFRQEMLKRNKALVSLRKAAPQPTVARNDILQQTCNETFSIKESTGNVLEQHHHRDDWTCAKHLCLEVAERTVLVSISNAKSTVLLKTTGMGRYAKLHQQRKPASLLQEADPLW
jgi:hypothetical protein